MSSKKTEALECSGCLSELPHDHIGIRCVQGHQLCAETCAKDYVKLILNEPKLRFPPKCPSCKNELNLQMVLRILDGDQIERFETLMLEVVISPEIALHDGETAIRCPFCDYFEFRECSPNEILYAWCRKESCEKTSCFTCMEEVEDPEGEEEQEIHFTCMQLREDKAKIDKALSDGNGVPCPGCGVLGMKDDACNHMVCENCHTEYCYVCGKRAEHLELKDNNFYSHFADWEKNYDRCPMYLNEIADVDADWPEDHSCLEHFHRLRTLQLLKTIQEEIGTEKMQLIFDHFQGIENSGFSLAEIQNAPDYFFKRDEESEESGEEESEEKEAEEEDKDGEEEDDEESEEDKDEEEDKDGEEEDDEESEEDEDEEEDKDGEEEDDEESEEDEDEEEDEEGIEEEYYYFEIEFHGPPVVDYFALALELSDSDSDYIPYSEFE